MPKRRRGSRSAGRLPTRRHARFEQLVERAVEGIPQPFRDVLGDEVALVIADEPSPAQLADNDLEPGDWLYGLYEGVPRSEWGADWVPAPNRITLFRIPLETDFADPEDLADEVRVTVMHELAHHLGIDEERMAQLGID